MQHWLHFLSAAPNSSFSVQWSLLTTFLVVSLKLVLTGAFAAYSRHILALLSSSSRLPTLKQAWHFAFSFFKQHILLNSKALSCSEGWLLSPFLSH